METLDLQDDPIQTGKSIVWRIRKFVNRRPRARVPEAARVTESQGNYRTTGQVAMSKVSLMLIKTGGTLVGIHSPKNSLRINSGRVAAVPQDRKIQTSSPRNPSRQGTREIGEISPWCPPDGR